jgi:hypothetical protein
MILNKYDCSSVLRLPLKAQSLLSPNRFIKKTMKHLFIPALFFLASNLAAQGTQVTYIPPNPGIAQIQAQQATANMEGVAPAATPGAEPGCAVNPRGSMQELACEETSYKRSATLRNFIGFMANYQTLTCNGITAQTGQANGLNHIDLIDPNGLFRLTYNQQQILIPGGVQSTYLWMTREKVLHFLQACKATGYPVHFPLPEPVQRAKTSGDF